MAGAVPRELWDWFLRDQYSGQAPDTGFQDWFLRDQAMVDRIGQGAVPNAQEPSVGLAQARLEAARRGPSLPVGAAPPPYGPGPSTLPIGAQQVPGGPETPFQPQGGGAPFLPGHELEAAFANEPYGPLRDVRDSFLGGLSGGAGGESAGWLADPDGGTRSLSDILGSSPAARFMEGGAPAAFGESAGGILDTIGRGARELEEMLPLYRMLGWDSRDPLGLGGGDANAADTRTPLEQAWEAMRARSGAAGAGAGPGGAGGGGGMGGGAGGASGGSAGRGGPNATGGGGGLSYDLGPVGQIPPVPLRAQQETPDFGSVLSDIEGAGPQRVEDDVPGWQEGLALAARMVGQLGPNASVGDILLAAGGGLAAGVARDKRGDAAEERAFQEQEREHKLRVADARLRTTELGSEYEQRRQDVDYENRLAEWKREAAILEQSQPQAQMTSAGMVIQDVGPDGRRRVRVDSRPIEQLFEMRGALKALGAGPQQTSDLMRQTLDPDSPEDLALNLAMEAAESPDMWPMLYGDNFGSFQAELEQTIGQQSAFATATHGWQGASADRTQTSIAQRALVRMLQRDIMNNPLLQQRLFALRAGQIPTEE
jgi:hypothetical protein